MRQKSKAFKKEFITVEKLISTLKERVEIELEEVNQVDTEARKVTEQDLHRPGLALAGYIDLFTYQRVQILGNTESQYLAHLDLDAQKRAFENLVQFPVPCVFLTENNVLAPEAVVLATKAGIPIYKTSTPTTRFMSQLGDLLNNHFAWQQPVHGSLVDVYGVGLLIVGKAGIGKSEVALDLVERGHRLVADDVVVVTKRGENLLIGTGTDLVQHFMEVRGLGLVDVRAMFGIRAIRFQKRIEVVVNMELWDPDEDYTRISVVDDTHPILDVDLPLVKVPITPGKNITVICEVIAMNHILRHYGYDPAEIFSQRLADQIQKNKSGHPSRGPEFLEHDYE
ncbi:MAG: HPr(Ser) kinase/phosphatase [Rhodothermales bacterium]